jgi:hypothetical protein
VNNISEVRITIASKNINFCISFFINRLLN